MARQPTPAALRPDGRRARGDRTRHTVLKHAMEIAATEGLEGLTFGGIASAAGVPKSTLQVLFKDRETLQLQTLTTAADEFAAGIRERLPADKTAFERLRTLCDAWFDLVSSGVLAGGCPVTAATAEYRARPGAIQTLVGEHRARWRAALTGAVKAAQEEGSLRPDVDPQQVVFEILAFQAAANVNAGDSAAPDMRRARRGVHALLDRARSPD